MLLVSNTAILLHFLKSYHNGTWCFNTSVCEQTNVWLGGYAAMLRDMEATRYTFFLDEMIKRRNRHVVGELERKGHCTWFLPADILQVDNS